MKESDLMAGNNGGNETQADWDVETIAEQILSDLDGAVNRSVVQETLKEIIPRYENARIQTYVPLFIRKDAVRRLRSELTGDASRKIEKANGRTSQERATGNGDLDRQ